MVNRAMNFIVTDYDENWVQLFKTEEKKFVKFSKTKSVKFII